MEKVSKFTQVEQDTKANGKMEKNMDMENMYQLAEQFTKDNGNTANLVILELKPGPMEKKYIKDFG